MAEITVKLAQGLKIGNTSCCVAVLRELTAGDLIDAMKESERLVMVPASSGRAEPQLLISNTLLSINTLRRQIASIGEMKGPIELETLSLLSAADLSLLQGQAEAMDSARAKDIEDRGRSEAAGEGG
jgi:phage FluMu protein gp41